MGSKAFRESTQNSDTSRFKTFKTSKSKEKHGVKTAELRNMES